MSIKFDFSNLFILDLANNHQGSLDHGLKVIKEHAKVAKNHGIRAAVKFQFRQLDTFIHPDFKSAKDIKHIPRFLETRISHSEFQKLFEAVKREGLLTICTPFDEDSVPLIEEMGFDIIKVASCSAKDWPLLERVAQTNLPVVFSTGSLLINDIDKFVSFAEHRAIDFAIMHCVSIYPTPSESCNLRNIAMMKQRYPGRAIGWSTHESPDDTNAVKIALALGADIFERHIGLPTDEISLNAYSSNPLQAGLWYEAFHEAKKLCGYFDRQPPETRETQSILELKRGVFTRKEKFKGDKLTRADVYFAMPCADGQLSSGQFSDGMVLTENIKVNDAIKERIVEAKGRDFSQELAPFVHEVKAMLNIAKIDLGVEFDVEYSHHYGIQRFAEVGCILINCINREYCKKLLVQLPKQTHPYHYHKRKEETFQVLNGEMFLEIDGRVKHMIPGDIQTVLPGTWHRFWSNVGCIVEEVSTTHFTNDSIYRDTTINDMPREDRKTKVKHWGRFQVSTESLET